MESEDPVLVLFERELKHIPDEDYLEKLASRSVNGGEREMAINWMLEVRETCSFGPQSVVLAVNYMDRFLSRYHLAKGVGEHVDMLLVAVTCLSLATKMEETVEVRMPFSVSLGFFTKFEADTIEDMEAVILKTLEWRMSAVTPLSYIDLYIIKLGIDTHDSIVLMSLVERVIKLITGTLSNIGFLQFRPSVVSATALLCAVEEIIPVQAKEYKHILGKLVADNGNMDACFEPLHQMLLQASCAKRRGRPMKRKAAALSVPHRPIEVSSAASHDHLRGDARRTTRKSSAGDPCTSFATTQVQQRRRSLRLEEKRRKLCNPASS